MKHFCPFVSVPQSAQQGHQQQQPGVPVLRLPGLQVLPAGGPRAGMGGGERGGGCAVPGRVMIRSPLWRQHGCIVPSAQQILGPRRGLEGVLGHVFSEGHVST